MGEVKYALGTFSTGERVFAGLVLDDAIFDVERRLDATVRELLEDWHLNAPRLQALADDLRAAEREYEFAALRPLPPVWPPGQVFQAGANYVEHLVELHSAGPDRMHRELTDEERQHALDSIEQRARDGAPYVFLGLPHAVVGAEDNIVLPYGLASVDWELELAAVIGKRARYVSREDADDVIAGYVICNDITARDLIYRPDVATVGTDWLAGKNWPTFLPTGPLLVPSSHVDDPMDVRITLKLNGETMQDCSTSDMMFDIGQLIEHVSSIAELRPGDMLLTGSPAGNGVFHGRFLADGDVVESEITGLGRQLNRCVAETAPKAPAEAAQSAQA
jgi:2,4-didehydro-3-deoxy-L-rhamnonate hydrolase